FRRITRRLLRQPREQRGRVLPKPLVARSVHMEIAGAFWRCSGPFADGAFVEAGRFQGAAINAHIRTSLCLQAQAACATQAFGRMSTTRLALPCDRSMLPGSSTRTVVLTPT